MRLSEAMLIAKKALFRLHCKDISFSFEASLPCEGGWVVVIGANGSQSTLPVSFFLASDQYLGTSMHFSVINRHFHSEIYRTVNL